MLEDYQSMELIEFLKSKKGREKENEVIPILPGQRGKVESIAYKIIK